MKSAIVVILIVCLLVVAGLLVVANSMTKPRGSNDEQMYCTGAALMSRGMRIYHDFAYLTHPPYHALLLSWVYRVTGTSHYLLAGRILSCCFDMITVLSLTFIVLHLFGKRSLTAVILAGAAAALYLFNPVVDYANGLAWNHDAIIALVSLATLLFVRLDFDRRSGLLKTACIAGLVTITAWMRLTTALVWLLFFIAVCMYPKPADRKRVHIILIFVGSSFVFSLWPLYLFLRDPQVFLLNVYTIPALASQWAYQMGLVFEKKTLIFRALAEPSSLIVAGAWVILLWIRIRFNRHFPITRPVVFWMLVLLPVVFLIIALIPPAMWIQYMAPPVPFLIISVLFMFRPVFEKISQHRMLPFAGLVAAVLIVVCTVGFFEPVRRIGSLFDTSAYEPLRLHEMAVDIAEHTEPGDDNRKLALTLAPLYALEGGCDIYPELAIGAFSYRIADQLTESQRQRTHTAGENTIYPVVQANPPDVVILGVDLENLEFPLYRYAVGRDPAQWTEKQYVEGPTVYFRK